MTIKALLPALLLLASSVTCHADEWPLADRTLDSVVYIETQVGEQHGSCTGFVINTEKHYILTAAHCDGTKVFADQEPARVVAKDIKSDLMVLQIEDLDRPALKLAERDPFVGQEVGSIGYGYGLEHPLFRIGHISADDVELDGVSGNVLALDTALVRGQSGGPIINRQGEVVMIVQLTSDRVGFGRGAERIRSKMGKFFEKR